MHLEPLYDLKILYLKVPLSFPATSDEDGPLKRRQRSKARKKRRHESTKRPSSPRPAEPAKTSPDSSSRPTSTATATATAPATVSRASQQLSVSVKKLKVEDLRKFRPSRKVGTRSKSQEDQHSSSDSSQLESGKNR